MGTLQRMCLKNTGTLERAQSQIGIRLLIHGGKMSYPFYFCVLHGDANQARSVTASCDIEG